MSGVHSQFCDQREYRRTARLSLHVGDDLSIPIRLGTEHLESNVDLDLLWEVSGNLLDLPSKQQGSKRHSQAVGIPFEP